MKINEKIAEVTTNFAPGATVEMTVDSNSMAHIMNTLTDMYKNPWEALARELISNGLDAHAEQFGIQVSTSTVFPKPVEVTLPTDLNPEFIVKDYGIGMSRDTLMNVFPKYGASTKRNTNDQIGGFGLGAKTPFAVSENFVVETVHNGKKNVAIFQKNERGVGEGNFLPEQDTDAENGTTIRVTLRNVYRLTDAFRTSNLLLGLPTGSVLVNGKESDNNVQNAEKYDAVSGDLGWVRKSTKRGDYYQYDSRSTAQGVIGTVVYSLNELFQSRDHRMDDDIINFARNVVLNIPIGTVDLTPSRDSLIFSQRTTNALTDAYKAARAAFTADVQARIDTIEDDAEILAVASDGTMRMNPYGARETPFKKNGVRVPLAGQAVKAKDSTSVFATTGRSIATMGIIYVDSVDIIVLNVGDATKANELASHSARFRKGVAASDLPENVNTAVVFLTGNLDAYSRWDQANVKSQVAHLLSVDEYLAYVEAGREVERKQARDRRAANKVERAESGIDQEVTVYRHGRSTRLHLSTVVKALKNFAYLSANAAVGTHAHSYALPEKRSEIKTFAQDIAQGGVNDFGLVFLPKSIDLAAFSKQFPEIKTVDEFLANLPQKQVGDVADVAAKAVISTRKFRDNAGWLFMNGMTDEKIAQIANPEFRAWAQRSRRLGVEVYSERGIARGYFSSETNQSYDSVVFTALPGFAEAKAEYLTQVPNYRLLKGVGPSYTAEVPADDVIEYLNMKNPA